MLALVMVLANSYNTVYITDNGVVTRISSFKKLDTDDLDSAKRLLWKNGISYTINDNIVVEAYESVTTISVKKPFLVKVTADGSTTAYLTHSGNVNDALSNVDVKVGKDDLLNYPQSLDLYPGIELVVNRVTYSEGVYREDIEYTSRREYDPDMNVGSEKLAQQGELGTYERRTLKKFIDGEMVEKNVISESVLKEPVEEVVKYGDWKRITTSRGDTIRYSKVINVKAYAYTKNEGGAGTKTATGKPLQVGYIAVDPRVIPLGTRLYVEGANGKWAYGYASAQDTGGAIKGNVVDLYFDTIQEINNFGTRSCKIYILE